MKSIFPILNINNLGKNKQQSFQRIYISMFELLEVWTNRSGWEWLFKINKMFIIYLDNEAEPLLTQTNNYARDNSTRAFIIVISVIGVQ